nr:uncharacterized protein LOC122271924 [Parasteatoda tepidariorum]
MYFLLRWHYKFTFISTTKKEKVIALPSMESETEPGSSNLGALIAAPIGSIVVLVALCYCMYRCCCCCCRRDKQVIVVNTTNMVQAQPENPSVVIVNNMPPTRSEFDNPVYNLSTAPLLTQEMSTASDWPERKF